MIFCLYGGLKKRNNNNNKLNFTETKLFVGMIHPFHVNSFSPKNIFFNVIYIIKKSIRITKKNNLMI
jgi:hypothetical protein